MADEKKIEIKGQKNNNMRISYWCHAWQLSLFYYNIMFIDSHAEKAFCPVLLAQYLIQ
jgi:hypothetical protein